MSRFLGLSIKYGYVSYCLIVDDIIQKFGSISTKCVSLNNTVKINNLFNLLKNEDKSNQNWFIGLQDDLITPRSQTHIKRLYNICKLRSIIECYSNSIFGVEPLFIKEAELYRILSKIVNAKITTNAELISYTRTKLKMLNSLNDVQFNNISIAWAITLYLKRRELIECYKMDEVLMQRVEDYVRSDRILNELLLNKDAGKEIESVIRCRINRLVDKYIERLID